MRLLTALIIFCTPTSGLADLVVPVRTIRPGHIVTDGDLKRVSSQHPDAYSNPLDVVGQEARVALYPNRPILINQVGPPALVERNQIVTLSYQGNTLAIVTEGRALERGAIGDRIRVMNLASRSTVFGFIQNDGGVRVAQ